MWVFVNVAMLVLATVVTGAAAVAVYWLLLRVTVEMMRPAVAPAIRVRDRRLLPQPVVFPEPLAAVNRAEHRADRPDAAAGDQIDADAGLVQRAQHACVIGPGGAGPGQHERGAKPRRVRAIRRI